MREKKRLQALAWQSRAVPTGSSLLLLYLSLLYLLLPFLFSTLLFSTLLYSFVTFFCVALTPIYFPRVLWQIFNFCVGLFFPVMQVKNSVLPSLLSPSLLFSPLSVSSLSPCLSRLSSFVSPLSTLGVSWNLRICPFCSGQAVACLFVVVDNCWVLLHVEFFFAGVFDVFWIYISVGARDEVKEREKRERN